jgi:hypothetical protein
MASVFSNIPNPLTKISPNGYGPLESGGLVDFISNLIKTLIIGAGIFAFINLVLAGFQYISSSGNAEQTTQAWQKIYLSLMGLAIMVAAFALAAVLGQVLFSDPGAILNPKIYGPGAK